MDKITLSDPINLSQEQIHLPGRIQSHGFLFALNAKTMEVEWASENIRNFTGKPAIELIGKPIGALESLISTKPGSSLTDLLTLGLLTGNFEQLNPQPVWVDGKEMFIIVHEYRESIICECEPGQSADDNITLQKIMSTALAVIQSSSTFPKLLDQVARLVKEIIGYDRIMVYKFHKDDHGEVVAEAKNEDLESWLHLHFPASDIPGKERELYRQKLVSSIPDIHNIPSELVGNSENDRYLDLTHSILQAADPSHVKYIGSMGFEASFSISLKSKNRLWGLILCYNKHPKFIDHNTRTACKFIGQLFSAALEFKHGEGMEEIITKSREKQVQLFEQLLKDMDPVEGLIKGKTTLLDINLSTGAVFYFQDKTYCLGITPTEVQITELVKWLKENQTGSFFQTSSLPMQFEKAKEYADRASGLMITPLSHDLSEYIMWFKPEMVRTINWAREKDLLTHENGNGSYGSPKGFSKWTQELRNTSEEWNEFEINGAIKLRDDVIQVVNKNARQLRKLNELLKEAYDELDTFSFTISHDLRTPLSSIKNYTEIILEDHGHELSEDARQLFDKVVRGTNKMASLIKNVLHYSRVGRATIEVNPIDMHKLLHEIREELLAPYRDRDIEFNIKNTPPISGDKTMIMQLFSNLAGNAVKYSTNAQVPRIEIDGEVKDGTINYTVTDNGIGIDMKHANRVFELFKRLDNVREIEGSGVGLAIAKRIVDKHQGKIWLESKPNNGTKFYVSIPETNAQNA